MNEQDRIRAVRGLNLLDTMPEEEYNQLVRLAASICSTPISLVSIVDVDRQWFKASVGLSARETPRNISFCSHAIQTPELFVIDDATQDHRFRNNPLVTGSLGIRFYAGLPLQAPGGALVGTLCVIDTVPRRLSEGQRDALMILGSQVQARLDLRVKNLELSAACGEIERLAARLETSSKLFRAFMDNSPFISYIKDPEGRMVFYNRHMAQRFGVEEKTWLGLLDHERWPQHLADQFRANDLEVLASGVPAEVEEVSIGPNDERVHWRSYKFPITLEDGTTMLAGMSVDITQEIEREKALIAANEKLDRLATTDALTGLSNRRAFDDRMAIEVSVARRKNRPFSLLMLDIDHFKARNDAFGHSSGDDALRMIGRVLRSFVRMGDMVARIGGEEFGYLLTDCDADSARIVGERICEQIRNTPCGEASITVSVGVATLDDTMPDWKYLVACADKALYAAKREGRDRVHVYPPGSPHDFDPLSPDPHGAWISCQPEADLTSAA